MTAPARPRGRAVLPPDSRADALDEFSLQRAAVLTPIVTERAAR